MTKIIAKEDLDKLLDSLLKDFEIIGPKEIANKGVFYEPIKNAQDLYLGENFAIEQIKKFFLSPSEWLFKEKYEGGGNVLEDERAPNNKRIIIGLRPCEARGLTLLDKVFNSDYKDSSYINNRDNSVIIGLSCSKPDKNCFCVSMDGSPVDTRGMDALLFESGDSFIVEITTDKGKELFSSAGEELDEDKRKSLELDKKKRKDLVSRKVDSQKNLDGCFESAYWQEVSFPCLSCGICTYLCPTCHCFDLVDEGRKRLRCYDGCAFVDFTIQTSGENPRPTKKERYRQRVFHKFNYFKKNFDENLCVGCGRCIRHCPVKIDIAEIVDKAPLSSS